jgi:hypothetical protein
VTDKRGYPATKIMTVEMASEIVSKRQGPPPRPAFEECRRNARRLLGDASDWIRAGGWRPLPTLAQRDAVRRALSLIGAAEDALDEAASMDTIDLNEEDR